MLLTREVLLPEVEQQNTQQTAVVSINDARTDIDAVLDG